MAIFDNLIARYCPSLDTTSNGTTTLRNLNALGNPVGSNNGTLTNMDAATDWVVDTSNGGTRALDFDGVNDYVNFANQSFGLNKTVAMWLFLAESKSFAGILTNRSSALNSINFQILQSNNNIQISAYATNGSGLDALITGVSLNTWYHLTIVTSGTNFIGYLNGVAVVSLNLGSGTFANSSQPFTLNTTSWNKGGSCFRGRVDDVCIFNVAKSPEDIAALASQRGFLEYNLEVNQNVIEVLGTPVPNPILVNNQNVIEVLGTPLLYNIDLLDRVSINQSITGTITTNVNVSSDLTINISSSNQLVGTIISPVVVLAGTNTITFQVQSLAKGQTTLTFSGIGINNKTKLLNVANVFNEVGQGGLNLSGLARVPRTYIEVFGGGLNISGNSLNYIDLSKGVFISSFVQQVVGQKNSTQLNYIGLEILGDYGDNAPYGAILSGGDVDVYSILNTDISNGCQLSGTSIVRVQYINAGVEIGGNSSFGITYSDNIEDGIVLSGNSESFVIYNNNFENGVILGGISIVKIEYISTAKIILSGNADNQIIVNTQPEDGVVLSGDVDVYLYTNIDTFNGCQLSGTSIVRVQYIVAGVEIGGDSNVVVVTNNNFEDGIVLSGNSESFVIYNNNFENGVILGGNASTEETLFGAILTGNSIISVTYNDSFGDGIVVNGNILIEYINRPYGIILSGTSLVNLDYNNHSENGVILGGGARDSILNGVVLSGTSIVRVDYISTTKIILAGSADNQIIINTKSEDGVILSGELPREYYSVGGLTLSGSVTSKFGYHYITSGLSKDTPPNFSGITIGYLNQPVVIKTSFNLDTNIKWGVDRIIQLDTNIRWNTGTSILYFYRLVGKPKYNDECDPISGIGECCKQFVMNIPARSIDDLCEKLHKRRWKWPIRTVQRFSRPAEGILDENCNILEDVEICNNIICEDFCVDYDLRDNWGYFDKSQMNANKNFDTSGAIIVSGRSDSKTNNIADYVYESSISNLEFGGYSIHYTNFVETFGGMILNGQAKATSSSWNYIGGEWPKQNSSGPKLINQIAEDNSDREWSFENNIFAEVDTSDGISSKYLLLKDFNLNIPNDAKIVGIQLDISRYSTGQVSDDVIYLIVGSEIISDNLASSNLWPMGLASLKSYGGINELWRNPEDEDYLGDWDIEDINNPEFGIILRVKPEISQTISTSFIDDIILNIYWENDQHINISGESRTKSINYHYTSDFIFSLNSDISIKKGVKYNAIGLGQMGPSFAGILIEGSYGQSVKYTADGEIFIRGNADIGSGGLSSSGVARIVSTSNHYTSEGNFTLSNNGTQSFVMKYISSGDLIIEGSSDVYNLFKVIANGSITFNGNYSLKSNVYNFKPDGNVIFIGLDNDTEIEFNGLGKIIDSLGWSDFVKEVQIGFKDDIVSVDTISTETINQCNCSDMSLILPLTHNIDKNNKFSQFLSKNNLSFSRLINLHWSQVNNSWLFNQSFEGLGASSNQTENWTIIFRLECTNLINGEFLPNKLWHFSLQVIQRNLVTQDDYDTKLNVVFTPESSCINSGFQVQIVLDTSTDFAFISPDKDVYSYNLNDNINLFNNQYWLLNPKLEINLSQIGLENAVLRYPLYIN